MVCTNPMDVRGIEHILQQQAKQQTTPSAEPPIGTTMGGFEYRGQGRWQDIETAKIYNCDSRGNIIR